MTDKNKTLLFKVAILFCCLIFSPPGPVAAGSSSLHKVTFMTQWVPQAQFAGYYVALETGLYRQYGLDVTIVSGGPNRSAAEFLKEKKTDFASLWLVTGLELYNQDVPVINLAQMVQRSALMLVAKKKSGIVKPGDMQGRRVGLWGPPSDIQPRLFFKKFGLKVEPVRQSYSVDLFLRDGVAVASAMWYNEYHMLLNAGLDPDELTTFFFSDYGLNYPEDGIYVLRETWQQKPDICRAFVRASLQGWRQAFSDPEQALDITMRNLKKAHITTNRTHQAWMLARMRDIMLPPGNGREMGHLDEEDFQRVIHGLSQQDGFQNAPSYQKFYQQPAVE